MARNGKIPRLAREIREELNQRLADNEPGEAILAWLHSLEAVQMILKRDFAGALINKQNLSDWRLGGFARWSLQQDLLEQARDMAADASELKTATDGRLADHLATVLAARYASVLMNWDVEMTEETRQQLKALHGMCRDVVALRRGDYHGARLKLEQDREEAERIKTDEEVVAQFQKWLANPKVVKVVRQKGLNEEERKRRVAKLFCPKSEGRMQNAEVSKPSAKAVRTKRPKSNVQSPKTARGPSGRAPARPTSQGDELASDGMESNFQDTTPPHPSLLPRGGEGTGVTRPTTSIESSPVKVSQDILESPKPEVPSPKSDGSQAIVDDDGPAGHRPALREPTPTESGLSQPENEVSSGQAAPNCKEPRTIPCRRIIKEPERGRGLQGF